MKITMRRAERRSITNQSSSSFELLSTCLSDNQQRPGPQINTDSPTNKRII